MSALAIAGYFPHMSVVHHKPVRDIPERRRRAFGFRAGNGSLGGGLRSRRADAKYLGRWSGCLFVEAREGRVYRVRCRCGAVLHIEPKRLHESGRRGCRNGCPMLRKFRAGKA